MFTFIVNLCKHFLCDCRKKVLDQNGPYINMFQTNLRNDCLSVILEFCLLSSSVCVLAPAYTSLCRELEYLPKVRYIILFDPNGAEILIFQTVFLGRTATLPYVWKIHPKAHIFTKLSQDVCLVDTHILIYWYARCNCKLLFLLTIHVWIVTYPPNFHCLCL